MSGIDKDKFDEEFDAEYKRINREVEETKARVEQEISDFNRDWEADQAAWNEMDRAMEGMARDFFRAITSGPGEAMDQFTVKTAAHFERFLDWHEESSKLWRNGYIGDELQADISRQFGAEAMGNWRLNLMDDSATPDEVLALQERMQEVCEHAAFVVGHIENKAADALPQPETVKPTLA